MFVPRSATAQHIRFNALMRPDAIALIEGTVRLTYAELDRRVAAAVRAVAALGIEPGQMAGVQARTLAVEWPLLLACHEQGIVTLSSPPIDAAPDLAFLDHFISDRKVEGAAGMATHTVSAADLLEPAEPGETALPTLRPDDPVRLLVTSGTTGFPKLIPLSDRALATRIQRSIWGSGLSRSTRFLMTYPFSVSTSYRVAHAVAWLGGTIVLEPGRPVTESIVEHQPTVMVALPSALRRLLDALPAGFRKPPSLSIRTLGAPVPPHVRRELIERLAMEVVETYGTNETGVVAEVDERRLATLVPGAEAEIVDDSGQPVPTGEAGRLRVRTSDMATGYHGAREATARMFIDGWFHPGDLAVMRNPLQFELLGRADDILNIGGIKVGAGRLEERVLEDRRIADAAITYIEDRTGRGLMVLALVPREGFALPALADEAVKRMNPGTRAVRVIALADIPRTATGKVKRDAVRHAAVQAIATMTAKPDPL